MIPQNQKGQAAMTCEAAETGTSQNRQRGSERANHKVNEYEVRTIRGLWPSHSFAVLARMYGISKTQAYRIVRGVKWRHVQ